MNPNTSLSLSVVAIAALVLLFASAPIISKQQAAAYVYYHGHHYHGHYYTLLYIITATMHTTMDTAIFMLARPHGIYYKGVTVRAY